MKELKYIYLEPSTCACPSDGAMWCEDMQTCDNCGKLYTQYIRADLAVNISKLEELIGCYEGMSMLTLGPELLADLQKFIDDSNHG